LDLCSDRHLGLNGRVDVDIRSRRSDCNDQRIAGQPIVAFEEGFLLPPPADRKHANRIPLGEIDGRTAPNVRMDRAPIAEGPEQPFSVRVREKIFRAFVVSRSILSWKDPAPARFDEILASRHAAAIMPDQITGASELGEKLEQAVHMALNEVVAILGFSLDPDDRAFATILKAKTTILNSVLNAQVRIDETRFRPVKEDRLERILAAAERSLSHLERAYGR
jgi:hypothetical protein